jgi:hypothetical protein
VAETNSSLPAMDQSLETIRSLLLGDELTKIKKAIISVERSMSLRMDKVQTELVNTVAAMRHDVVRDLKNFRTALDDEIKARLEVTSMVENNAKMHKQAVATQMNRIESNFDKLSQIIESKLDILESRIDRRLHSAEESIAAHRDSIKTDTVSRHELVGVLQEITTHFDGSATRAPPRHPVQQSIIVEES